MNIRVAVPAFVALSLTACGSGGRMPADSRVATTVTALDAGPAAEASGQYRIGPSDKLALSVFQVEDLSFEAIYVDASGNLQLPLLGSVKAEGMTPAQLSADLQMRLAERYLRNPQVVVTVVEAASQKITVDGAVTKPGVYEMRGRTTLMQAVAMAEGPTRIADLQSVAVFRTVENRRMVAVFDLAAIRAGQAADPTVLGDDVIVVDTSRLSANVREVLQALPGLAVFGYL
jgi:polysaccharide export outer membrane protein